MNAKSDQKVKVVSITKSVLSEKSQLTFNLTNNLKYVIEIFSLDGWSLSQKKGFVTEASITLEAINPSPGIYWIRVMQAKNSIEKILLSKLIECFCLKKKKPPTG